MLKSKIFNYPFILELVFHIHAHFFYLTNANCAYFELYVELYITIF